MEQVSGSSFPKSSEVHALLFILPVCTLLLWTIQNSVFIMRPCINFLSTILNELVDFLSAVVSLHTATAVTRTYRCRNGRTHALFSACRGFNSRVRHRHPGEGILFHIPKH